MSTTKQGGTAPRKPKKGRLFGVLAVVLVGMLFAPILGIGGLAVMLSGLFAGGETVTSTASFDPELVAAATAASERCEAARPEVLIAAANIEPPGPASLSGLTVAWGESLTSSGQFDALKGANEPAIITTDVAGVVDAIAVVWCALYPEVSAAYPDSADRSTFLALGVSLSGADAVAWVAAPSALDALRGDRFDALVELARQQAATQTSEFNGVITAGGWTHPLPDMGRYWGNYGADRGTYLHAGEDLAASLGSPLYAAADGVVSHVSCKSFKGRSPCNVLIDVGTTSTGEKVQLLYVHMFPNQVGVQVGDQVTAGQEILAVGNNGNSTGPHLHLEVWINGKDVNPTKFFAGQGVDLRNPSIKPPAPAPAVSANASGALTWARTQIGKPYVWGATGPDSYDCSGLVLRAFESAGMSISRNSRAQYQDTARITRAELQPGDLVFWSHNGTAAQIYHVAIYAGKDASGRERIVQAPSPGKTVEETNLYEKNLFGFGRLN